MDPAETNEAPARSASEHQQRMDRYDSTYDELVKKQISNSENFDRSILTLSSSALGLSLAFIKDVTPVSTARYSPLLISSWWLFGFSIVATIASFMTSQCAIRDQITASEKYYIDGEEDARKETAASKWTEKLNLLSGIAFIIGIVLTIVFVTLNLPSKPKANEESSKASAI
jgi:hypothetical protein